MAASIVIRGNHHSISHQHDPASVLRTDSTLSNFSLASSHGGEHFLPHSNYMEKRQLFLRSYQFSRKKSFSERIKSFFSRFRRLASLRLRSARRLRRVVWSRLRFALFQKRRRFSRLAYRYPHGFAGVSRPKIRLGSRWPDSCFW